MLVKYQFLSKFFFYIKENYDQGLRRMNRACSDTIIISSNLEEQNSSEEEIGPLQLTGPELKESLNNIGSFNENEIFSINTVDKKSNDLIK